MNNWKKIDLGDIATFHNGYAFKPTDWSDEGQEIIRIQNLTKGAAQINYYTGVLPDKYKVRKGDLLISWSATLGIYEWDGSDAWLNQHLFKVVFDKEETDELFFKFLIGYSLRKMEEQVHGATMKHITKKKFDAFPILFPPLETQKKIAAILDAADAYRQKTKALIAKYEELTQSVFLEMFGDPVKNEKGWEKRKVGELTESRLGKMLDKRNLTGENLKCYIKNTNVKWLKIETEDLDSMDFSEKEMKEFRLIKGDVLVCEGGEVGRAAIWNNEIEECYFQKALHRVRMDDKKLNNYFFVYWLKNFTERNGLKDYVTSATIAHLTGIKFKSILMIVPEINLQNQFAARVQKIEAQKAQAQQSLEKAEELFNSLLQRAFKGELV